MSKPIRIGLIAEGPLDHKIIDAALQAIIRERSYVLTLLQPEITRPELKTGWEGVVLWCHNVKSRILTSIDDDPFCNFYDMLIIHIDGDVAFDSYSSCNNHIVALSKEYHWCKLPCSANCPPASETCNNLEMTIHSWLKPVKKGNRTVICIPAMSPETWIAVAVLPPADRLFAGNPECYRAINTRLNNAKLEYRVKKTPRDYERVKPKITGLWSKITNVCDQAKKFEADVLSIVNTLTAQL
jgi:hypothetical protein